MERLLQQSVARRCSAIGRLLRRIRDYCRLASRYDKLATNVTTSHYRAAATSFWL